MNFVNFLKTKQKFIIIWLVIHGLALFVNKFNIEAEVPSKNEKNYEVRNNGTYPGNYEVLTYRITNILTTAPSNYYGEKGNSSFFWPFVKFYKSEKFLSAKGFQSYFENRIYTFNGIFYRYDISEFIAYNILLILVFYFLWSTKKTSI